MLRTTVLPLVLFALLGCRSATYDVSIDSRTRAFPSGRYYLIPTVPEQDPQSLEFLEFRAYADHLLAGRGLERVDDLLAADIVVGFGYAIDEGERISHATSMPVFGERFWGGSPYGFYDPSMPFGWRSPYWSSWGVIGYRYHHHEETAYQRSSTLIAWPAEGVASSDASGAPPQAFWHTEIASRGGSDDLRHVLPAMLFVAREYVGTDTGGKVEVEVPVDSPEVADWRSAALAAAANAEL